MHRVLAITVAAALSSIAFAGVSQAGSLGMNTAQGIEQTLRTFHGNDFNVEQVYNWRNRDDETTGPRSAPERSGQAVHGIQASIDANRSLAHRLNNKGVDVRNIVNAEQAADGSLTFYVR
ncbi:MULTISPECIES: hypothetical protein [Rhizobium]|uniref:Uncharacterized protein n=1 Tax=Rhizobium changzhiense TaxID=2692317 RepID=A0A7Z0RDP8_9HYPH|nr:MULTISPECIES: hypothetical protein [Rhizobium]MBA5803398.1 hypothetical protein [Rhizobium changzhiense]MCH4545196.1 hypothetical protein [Rhizobium changzhiense]MCV9943387.1 hypothetical protein [Rhizobium sp. BT-175]MCW0016953.1 hypothetical protein [Rhizobium sp. BT-226]NNU45720.1 hypothetical protein [Rhizobium changzhiense]